MTPFLFVLASLACYRISVLLVLDVGPWEIFKKLRGVTRFSKLLSCVFCTSLWVAAMIEAAFYFSGVRDSAVVALCTVFSLSAITIILNRCFTSDYKP